MLQEQQEGEIKGSYLEENVMVEEKVPGKVESEEQLGFPETPRELLSKDEEIYKRLNIPWNPNQMQSIAGNKTFDSKKENLQRSVKQYKYQVEYMQKTNDGLVMANRRLREDLDEVNRHYQELIAVSKEALKRKRNKECQFTMLKQTIKDIEQQNEELTRKMAEMEADQLKARIKSQALEGIALLAEAAKDL